MRQDVTWLLWLRIYSGGSLIKSPTFIVANPIFQFQNLLKIFNNSWTWSLLLLERTINTCCIPNCAKTPPPYKHLKFARSGFDSSMWHNFSSVHRAVRYPTRIAIPHAVDLNVNPITRHATCTNASLIAPICFGWGCHSLHNRPPRREDDSTPRPAAHLHTWLRPAFRGCHF